MSWTDISLTNISLANISLANISPASTVSVDVFFRLRRLQASLLDGGKRADDKDLKEKRLKKKKAAEKRLKVTHVKIIQLDRLLLL